MRVCYTSWRKPPGFPLRTARAAANRGRCMPEVTISKASGQEIANVRCRWWILVPLHIMRRRKWRKSTAKRSQLSRHGYQGDSRLVFFVIVSNETASSPTTSRRTTLAMYLDQLRGSGFGGFTNSPNNNCRCGRTVGPCIALPCSCCGCSHRLRSSFPRHFFSIRNSP